MKAASTPTSITPQYEEELSYKILFWTFVLSIFIPVPLASAAVSLTAGFNLGWKVGGEKKMPFIRRLWHSTRCAVESAAMSVAIFAGVLATALLTLAVASAITTPPLAAIGMVALAIGGTYIQGKLGAKATLWVTNRLNKKAPLYSAPQPPLPSASKTPNKIQQVGLKIVRILAKPVEWIVGKITPTPDPEDPAAPTSTSSNPPAPESPIKLSDKILNGLRSVSTKVARFIPASIRKYIKGSGKTGP